MVSELLQNADDAGATEAEVIINDNEFIFSHNGEDFNEDNLRSICQFGFSNKRSLHTIGFRGIGFKSTFSLGDEVFLLTPTLSVKFSSSHFTEPIWVNDINYSPKRTEIHVKLKDDYCLEEVKKNLDIWIENPTSLLFFKNIRSFRILGKEISWNSLEHGPIENSTWVALKTKHDDRFLHIKSDLAEFPIDCLEEISKKGIGSI